MGTPGSKLIWLKGLSISLNLSNITTLELVSWGIWTCSAQAAGFLCQDSKETQLFASYAGNQDLETHTSIHSVLLLLCFKDFIYFLVEKGREGEREVEKLDVWEKHWSFASHMLPVQYLACNPGMCPDWESNPWPVGLLDDAQPTEPHQSGPLRSSLWPQTL